MALQPFMPVTIVMAMAVIGVIAKTKLSFRELLKTPHDWLVLLYCFWMVYTSSNRGEDFKDIYPLFLFYLVVVHALSNLKRMATFLKVWTGLIIAVATLAVVAPLGFDPTGSEHETVRFLGRRTLGTSIFNNPNSLGHSVVPGVIMLYFIFVWRRPIFSRIAGIPLFFIPLYCIYLTQSKGSFISGFAAAVSALAFGRPKYAQIAILVVAMTGGWGAMQLLPRMEQMKESKTNEAIQGRVAAFSFGMESYKKNGLTGFGFKTFAKNMYREEAISKASHSSYVQIGAELGKVGFWLFLGTAYCCLRTLVVAKPRNDSEERARRMLFTVLVAYLISSWMVDFAYYASFFICVGAVAAFHRLMLSPLPAVEEAATNPLPPVPAMQLADSTSVGPTAVPITSLATTNISPGRPLPFGPPANEEEPAVDPALLGIRWNRFGLIDVALVFLMQYAALAIWSYSIRKM